MAKKVATNNASIEKSVSQMSSAAPKKGAPPAKKHLKSQAAGVAAAVEGFVQAIVGPAADTTEKIQEAKIEEPKTPAAAPKRFTEEEIAIRAYELYLERGNQSGSQADDWFRAEQSLRSSAN